MQLMTDTPRRGALAQTLSVVAANLFLATGALADDRGGQDVVNDLGMTRIDAAVLSYQEAGGRVQATEPVISATLNANNGDVLSIKLTSDSLTGATPNGAAPWRGVQTFVTPAHPPNSSATVTSASGNSTIISVPGAGIATRQYTTAAGQQPVDGGFHDQRFAANIGYSTNLSEPLQVSVGGGASTERDFRSVSLSGGAAYSLFQKNTTLSGAVNLEFDQSRPFFGAPTPLTVMSATQKGGNATKNVYSFVGGVTQVMNRIWLTQLNYEIGQNDGYQNDPYKIISVVDPTSGAPVQYLYESRPKTRLRQSLFWGNKLALGPTFADLSVRGYHDSWGINSVTVELAERVPLRSWVYVEPQVRYYSQSAADFYRAYLLSGTTLPAHASADQRLAKFDATTAGVKLGFKLPASGEFYVLAEHYQQHGHGHQAGAPGELADENLFYGVRATSLTFGVTMAFF